MLRHEFIAVSPSVFERYEVDYPFFQKYASDASVIRGVLTLPDEIVMAHYGFKRDDFRVSGMTAENFYPELMKFFSAFSACTPEGVKTIGLCYWGITLLKEQTLREIVRLSEKERFRGENEMLRFVKFCRDALEEGLWVVHFGV